MRGNGERDVQFSSVQSLDLLGCRGNMRDDSAEILFPSVLRKPIVISAGRKRNTITFFFQGKILLYICSSANNSCFVSIYAGQLIIVAF